MLRDSASLEVCIEINGSAGEETQSAQIALSALRHAIIRGAMARPVHSPAGLAIRQDATLRLELFVHSATEMCSYTVPKRLAERQSASLCSEHIQYHPYNPMKSSYFDGPSFRYRPAHSCYILPKVGDRLGDKTWRLPDYASPKRR